MRRIPRRPGTASDSFGHRWRVVVAVIWCGVAALFCSAALVGSEAGRALVVNHTMRDYLAHNQVWHGVQDSRGVLYFGNRDAILEFDGERWGQIPVPGGLFIRGLAIDDEGTLWVAGTNELGFLQADESAQLHYVSLLKRLPEEERVPGEVWEVYSTPDGVFFQATHAIFRWRDGGFTTWHRDSPRSVFISYLGGAMQLFERTVGLSRLEGDAWVLISEDDFFKNTAVFRSFEEPDGSWTLATAALGLFRYGHGVVEPLPTLADEFIKTGDLYDAHRLRDGSLALGTLLNGLVILRPDGSVETVVDVASGMQDNSVKHILEGRDGGLWLSLGNGVSQVQRGAFTVFDERRGLQPNTVHQILRHRGRLYAAANLGLYELQPGTEIDGAAKMSLIDGIPGRVMAILSHESGLIVANRRTPILYDGESTSRIGGSHGTVHQLYRSRSDPPRVFVGTGSGLNAMRWKDGAWTDEGVVPGLDGDVRDMAQTADGILWAGTPSRGILRIDFGDEGCGPLSNAQVIRYTDGHGLPGNPGWTSAHLSDEGDVFFRTAAGLYTVDEEAAEFRPYPKFGRRFSDGTFLVSRMAWDATGTVWASVYPLAEEKFASPWGRGLFGRAIPDGRGDHDWLVLSPELFSPIANLSALLVEEDANERVLWVGANAGLVRIDLNRVGEPDPMPEVIVRTVTSSSERVLFGGASAAGMMPPQVPYPENDLRFTFAAPFHGTARSILYQSMLGRFDQEWSKPSRTVDRVYTNLFEGKYSFRVRAVDAGDRTGPEAVFEFWVRPPAYRTAGAYVVYALCGGFLVLGIVRLRSAALRRENMRLEHVITERTEDLRVARDEADRANRAKSMFLANMSHELRTPLNGILGYTQILRRDGSINLQNQHRLNVLQTSGEHLLRLINEVLDLSKIEAGRIELHPGVIDLRSMVDAVTGAFRPRIEEKALDFVVEVDAALPARVIADEQKLSQVLFNLLGNAVKFTDHGRIEMRLSARGNGVRVEVIDTGSGIAAEEQALIFQPFQQAASSPLQADGTGLGLSICSRIINLMSGKLQVESEPGRGSRFWFDVPLRAADETAKRDEPASLVIGYEGPRRKVLVVDDVAVNRSIVVEMLGPLGFEVAAAPGGAECLAGVAKAPPDLILLDLRMSPMSGQEVVQQLRESAIGRAIRIVSFSASTFGFTREDARAMGCDDYLPKPFREEELLEVLQRQLNLTWRLQVGESTVGSAGEHALPDAGETSALLAYARRGDAAGLRAALKQLTATRPELREFAEDLDQIASQYRMREIRDRLEAVASPNGG